MRRTLLAFMLFSFAAAASLAFAQNDGTIHLPPSIRHGQDTSTVPVRSGDEANREQMQKAMEIRQEEIRRDTQKLFQLSTELRDYVAKADQSVLSLDALKKAEQIEKLAKSVKSKLKQSY